MLELIVAGLLLTGNVERHKPTALEAKHDFLQAVAQITVCSPYRAVYHILDSNPIYWKIRFKRSLNPLTPDDYFDSLKMLTCKEISVIVKLGKEYGVDLK